MSKQASKTLIGAFVMGAIALLIFGILIFGSGRFFSERGRYVLYFGGSVRGLNVGSPVTFRGVKIGQVVDINLRLNPKDRSLRIEVFIETDPKRISVGDREAGVTVITGRSERERLMKEMIAKRGLKAQLALQSLVTGLLEVGLDFYPETPASFVGTDPNQIEIPTVPSDMEKLQATLSHAITKFEELPIEEIVKQLVNITEGLNRLLNSPQLEETVRSFDTTLKELQSLVRNLNSQVSPMSANIQESAKAARGALEQAQKTLDNAQKIISENSGLRFQILQMMEEVSSAARSLRIMTDYLEQHPEAVIRGKGQDE
ncbi:MAG TPA: MlaD family protein [Thermodesulfobacteriota bacterium]|nr:MlaD family protein [Thermodesulfobacteriota bacterium]